MSNVKDFLKRKDIVITPQRYLIEALWLWGNLVGILETAPSTVPSIRLTIRLMLKRELA